MKKTKNFRTIIMCLLLATLSLGFFGNLPRMNANAESVDISTLFIRDAKVMTNNNNNAFIYDDLDKQIKMLDLSSEELNLTLTAPATEVLSMRATAANLFVLTSSSLNVLSATTLESVTLENLTAVTDFSIFSSISLFEKTQTEILIILTPKSSSDKKLTILNINLAENKITESFEVTFKDSFITQDLSDGFTSVNILGYETNSIKILLQSGSHFYTFGFNTDTKAAIDTWTTLTFDEQSLYSMITNVDDTQVIVTVSATKISYFTYDPALSPAISDVGGIELESIADISLYNSKLITKKNGSFSASVYDLSKSDSMPLEIISTLSKSYTNVVFESAVLPATEIQFFSLTSEAMSYLSPYSPDGTLIPSGTHVALLSIPTVNGNDFGYSYCLVVSGENNIFGYIKSDALSPLLESENPYNDVFVIDGTNLYTLPSNVTGEENGNPIISKLSMNDKVKVLSTACDANMGGRQYVQVEVNGKTGYILRDRIYGTYKNYNLIVTNAYTKTGVDVYAEADTTSEIIDSLHAGARIKVLSTRRIDSNFMQVTYNDDNGNVVTGYVLSSAIETDSWSMLQILGMVLVIINLLFLLVILAVRKRVNKD